jgi:hypothetical protein
LPFGNIAAHVPIKSDEAGINRFERLVLGEADFFFDFGDNVSLGMVEGHGWVILLNLRLF